MPARNHLRALVTSSVAGDRCRVSLDLKCRLAKTSSFWRRSASDVFTSELPRSSTSRSKIMKRHGVSSLNFLIRLAAGWIRIRRLSKESVPSSGITISPSRTNCLAGSSASADASSGKYLVSGLPALDNRSTRFPSRNARQRKPSHLGSYCQSGPDGNSDADRASIGRYRLLMGNDMYFSCLSYRISLLQPLSFFLFAAYRR